MWGGEDLWMTMVMVVADMVLMAIAVPTRQIRSAAMMMAASLMAGERGRRDPLGRAVTRNAVDV